MSRPEKKDERAGRDRCNDRSETRSLVAAVCTALAATNQSLVAQDSEKQGHDTLLLEEVLVTATKRPANRMDLPESIQALAESQLERAGVYNLDDYARLFSSLSYVSLAPGQARVIFRGIAANPFSLIAEPSAALYLNEQSLTMQALPDVRIVDIERIEALSGPQGTLYGASAQSGVLRIITNKPDPDRFDARFDALYKTGSHSSSSYDVHGMLNYPVSDRVAVRLVGFAAEDGGFIDNIQGLSPRFGLHDNAGKEQDDYNSTSYLGGRIAARWLINDQWSMDASIIHQDTRARGSSNQDPTLDRGLATVKFLPERDFDDSQWTQYALTFEGDLGFADFVSATAYFTRDWTYSEDTSTGYAAYFSTFCYSGDYFDWSQYSRYCFQAADVGNYYNDPVGYRQQLQEDTRLSQEFRLSSQGANFDWLAGVFYEESDEHWDFDTIAQGYNESKSMANYLAGNLLFRGNPIPERQPDDTWWYSTQTTDRSQKAVFGELTWHMAEQWDMTLGGRWFDQSTDRVFWIEQPKYNLSGGRVGVSGTSDSGFVPKFSISYKPADQVLLYGLYSEGFRPGSVNIDRGNPFHPIAYDSDVLENIEIGTKMTLADDRVRFTLTWFDMTWDDYQLDVVDPGSRPCGSPGALPPPNCGQSFLRIIANVGQASSKGFEVEFEAVASENLSLGFNGTWLDSTLDEEVEISVVVPAGTRLPLTPELKGSVYAQLGWPVSWFDKTWTAFARLQWSYVGDMYNFIEPSDQQFLMPSYQIGDFRMGIDGKAWSVQAFINNITDERAILFGIPSHSRFTWGHGVQTVNRPREFGVRFIRKFGGK